MAQSVVCVRAACADRESGFIGSRSQETLFDEITDADSARRREWIPMSHRGPPLSVSDAMYEYLNQFRYPNAGGIRS